MENDVPTILLVNPYAFSDKLLADHVKLTERKTHKRFWVFFYFLRSTLLSIYTIILH